MLFVGYTLPMQTEFPRFGGLRSEIYRLAPCMLWCIISLLTRINDGNQVAPLTREHPRRRYTPVDTPMLATRGSTCKPSRVLKLELRFINATQKQPG